VLANQATVKTYSASIAFSWRGQDLALNTRQSACKEIFRQLRLRSSKGRRGQKRDYHVVTDVGGDLCVIAKANYNYTSDDG
jgi:hypothetical protein